MKRLKSGIVYGLFALLAATGALQGQTITSGDITGTITDPSTAAMANVSVTLLNKGTGAKITEKTSSEGTYRFAFLPAGEYSVTASAAGFADARSDVQVLIGQVATANLKLAVASASTTVQVEENAVTLQTENADISTTFTSQQVENLPNPGNDMTYIAQTSPGAVQNTQAGYGNFSTFGLPGTANLFTTNGQNNMDPYFNLNNSGATNLTLGSNEVGEVSVINNGYSGQYGQLAGSQVNFVTKTGTNDFHGNLAWYYNGRTLNANDWFLNNAGQPRNFDVFNQWAASAGGPVWIPKVYNGRNKTFFFFNTEGLRLVLPSSANKILIPSSQFQSATLANLLAIGRSSEIPFYNKLFGLYNSSSGAKVATPVPADQQGGCDGTVTLAGNAPCASSFQQAGTNFTHERIWSIRVDQQIGQNDHIYGRYYSDNGLQATGTDPINNAFNTESAQPAYQGQFSWTHAFGATAVNQFLFSGFYYTALFGPSNFATSLSTFPTDIQFGGATNSGFFQELAPLGAYPSGRLVYQWQYVDDFSKILGKHSIKTGLNYHRNPYTDVGNGQNALGTVIENSMLDFFNGGGIDPTKAGNVLTQAFPQIPQVDLLYQQMGGYIQDEWRVTSNLKLTLALRADHNSNLYCAKGCFTRFSQSFPYLNHDSTVPYNQALTNQKNAFPGEQYVIWQPRIGFAWSPNSKTVIRGGAGVFGDSIPLYRVGLIASNSPNVLTFTAANLPLDPSAPGSLFAATSGSDAAFKSAFSNGGTLSSIKAAVAPLKFSPPVETGTDPNMKPPRYYEWNFEIQRDLGWGLVGNVNYVGNHGSSEFIINQAANAYCPASKCGAGSWLPTSAPDSRFGKVYEFTNSAYSNYHGLVTSLTRRFSHGFLFSLNYTWSHATDICSNGCQEPFGSSLSTDPGFRYPQDPYDFHKNYGSADYDVRHYVSANYVWDNALRHLFHAGPNAVFGGWTISGTLFHRTGLPFSVRDQTTSSALSGFNYNTTLFANIVGPVNTDCGKSSVDTPCFGPASFAPASNGASNQGRNIFRGPNYFNTDVSVTKKFFITERTYFSINANFFNVLNHPNFDMPHNNLGSPGSFGLITQTVGSPTSIYGAFVGAEDAPRIIELSAKFNF